MDNNDYKNICELAIPLVREVGEFIRKELGQVTTEQIEVKEPNSLVSYVDQQAERILVAGLGAILPSAGFITEEDTVYQGAGDAIWIIDPLDGTSNFLHGIPHFAVSVGLRVEGVLQVGIVLDVMRRECFYAWKGGGAYMNEQVISVSTTGDLSSAMVGTGFPYEPQQVRPLMGALEHFMLHGRGIRRLGAAALDMAYVAAGRMDIYYESTLNIWDIAGGALIVLEAGGCITEFDGGDGYLASGRVVVANEQLLPVAQEVIWRYFGE